MIILRDFKQTNAVGNPVINSVNQNIKEREREAERWSTNIARFGQSGHTVATGPDQHMLVRVPFNFLLIKAGNVQHIPHIFGHVTKELLKMGPLLMLYRFFPCCFLMIQTAKSAQNVNSNGPLWGNGPMRKNMLNEIVDILQCTVPFSVDFCFSPLNYSITALYSISYSQALRRMKTWHVSSE